MKITKSDLLKIMYEAVDEFNISRDRNDWLLKSENTELIGAQSLDSLSFVDFIVVVEGRISDKYDMAITIADDRAMSERNSPFRTIESLADYLVKLLSEK
jgi:acyl carrier protein